MASTRPLNLAIAPKSFLKLPATYRCLAVRAIATTAGGHGPSFVPHTATEGPMSRLQTKTLLRTLALTSIMSSPLLSKMSVAVMGLFAKSKSPLLHPDSNPIVKRLLRWTVYDHFCAGEKSREVRQTVSEFKQAGYQGVILTYAKEIVLDPSLSTKTTSKGEYAPAYYEMVKQWKETNLETVRMLSPGDILSIKLTGAGPMAIEALESLAAMPAPISEALNSLCEEAQRLGTRVWLDAEQQRLQHGIDEWALELMRRFNTAGQPPLVYNTIQAYLKNAEANTTRHILAAAKGNFSLGIKLVRGAYIEHEQRSLIHDTKADTDAAFDNIAASMINQTLPTASEEQPTAYPASGLFLATHNTPSTVSACTLHRERLAQNAPSTLLECAQLAGMADDLSSKLISNYESTTFASVLAGQGVDLISNQAPRAYKYLTWGSVGECLGYLHRRAVENGSAVGGANYELTRMMRGELKRRVVG